MRGVAWCRPSLSSSLNKIGLPEEIQFREASSYAWLELSRINIPLLGKYCTNWFSKRSRLRPTNGFCRRSKLTLLNSVQHSFHNRPFCTQKNSYPLRSSTTTGSSGSRKKKSGVLLELNGGPNHSVRGFFSAIELFVE